MKTRKAPSSAPSSEEELFARIQQYGEKIVAESQSWHDYNSIATNKKPAAPLDYYFKPTSGYLVAIEEFISALPSNEDGLILFNALRNSVSDLFTKLAAMGYGIFGQESIAQLFFGVNQKMFAKETRTRVTPETLAAVASKYAETLNKRFTSISHEIKRTLQSGERRREFTSEERTWDNPFYSRVLQDARDHKPFKIRQFYQKVISDIDPDTGTITLASGRTLKISRNASKVWAIIRLILGCCDEEGYAQLPRDWDKPFETRPNSLTEASRQLYYIRQKIKTRTCSTKGNRGWCKLDLQG